MYRNEMETVHFINLVASCASNGLPSGVKELNCVCELEERLGSMSLECGAFGTGSEGSEESKRVEMLSFSDVEKEWQWRGVGNWIFPCHKVVGSSGLATCWQRGGKEWPDSEVVLRSICETIDYWVLCTVRV